jgi:2-(1,2-epoxy-1,2-dihydrophenyl)acetyl-CoA isomerase
MSDRRAIETGTDHLLARIEDGVAVITMNRPERRNALSDPMFAGMAAALAEAEADPEVRCVVLTGAGGAFCAGGDVKGMNERNQGATDGAPGGRRRATLDEAIAAQRRSQRATAGKLYEMPKPTLAALPGAAAGAGLALALACDLRIASENAVMVTAFAKVGFSGDYGGTFFLSQLVGSAKARELYFLSERVDAKTAERLGLVNWVVAESDLVERTMEIARRLAAGPAIAYRYMKENLNRAVGGEMGECMDLEATHHVHTGRTEDHRNAARAFVEKKPPVFHGR